MTQLNLSEKTAKYIDILIDTAESEKAAIADALTTASDARVTPIADDGEYMNLCSVLGRYNRLLSLITSADNHDRV